MFAAGALATVFCAPAVAQADTGGGATTFSFESDAVGSVPAGCTTPAGRAAATVSDERAHDGSHSLRIHDTSSSALVVSNCENVTQQGAEMSLEIYPVNALSVMIDIDGVASKGPTNIDGTAVFHLRVQANGAMGWYSGTGWQSLAPAGTVAAGRWSLIQLAVPSDNSSVYVGVNGTDVASAGPATGSDNPIRAITGFGFASSGTAAVGDDAFVDSVTFGPLTDTEPGVPPTRDFTPGAVDGLESDAVGSVPSGCGTPVGSVAPTVSAERAHAGRHSVRVTDTSPTSQALLTCATPAVQGAYLSFEMYPVAVKGFAFDITGSALIGAALPGGAVFHLRLGADGALSWDQLGAWYPLAPAGTVPIGRWSHVQLSVPVDDQAVHVTVDGTYVGSGGPAIGNNSSRHDEITAITGFAFASAGPVGVGDDVFVDDVTFGPVADTPTAALGTAPFEVGLPATIDAVGQVQLPTSDVVVPHGDGQRILADYPAHSDASNTNGNRMAYSDDGGVTWASDQQSNPMPDAPSFFLTRLRDGGILAVDYHTYMTPDSGDLQSEVDTAVSHDGGATWTVRSGILTTPQPMRTISSVTDRPGSPLGGFVLVHSVVEDADGTLYQTGYGYYAPDVRYRSVLLVSHDGGVDWSIQGTIASDDPAMDATSGYQGPCEAVIERLADGSLLAVMRQGSYLPMTYARSTDDGRTWTAQKQVATGPSAQPLYSVYPTMELMPTGELVLLAGRPGMVMTVSKDGRGDDWSTPVGIDYTNSENGVFTALDSATVLVLGDRGRVTPWQVWARAVGVDAPCTQVVTGVHNGPLSAGAGGLCLDHATVNGSVTVSDGGRLIVQGSAIRGPLRTSGASVVSLCGSTVSGTTTLTGTVGNVSVGDTIRGCDPDTLTGALSIGATHGRVVVDRAEVTGPVAITGTRGAMAAVLSGVVVHGPLSCTGNSIAPTDSAVPDTVDGPSRGQCAALG
ncbi:hypothetical protein GCM10025881_33060 [Pseudolysinimonas kribbensis]|uniref:Sialidase domain-containing protein n=1 Tax=Pseudolysinimonas kribbensis TaxID=433641 RepID=A0ABQ6KD33_9MICO|nr:sialidase family protein [Pseudolysinimonas kribbensis]GMA96482.1 hypothetical protein GCM10025881_33060 [Pseudolysinimonas kribbensis]